MGEQDSDILYEVQRYRKVVLLYEALNAEIDNLMNQHSGSTETMPPDMRERYRDLARKRDDIMNEMLLLEQELNIGEDDVDV